MDAQPSPHTNPTIHNEIITYLHSLLTYAKQAQPAALNERRLLTCYGQGIQAQPPPVGRRSNVKFMEWYYSEMAFCQSTWGESNAAIRESVLRVGGLILDVVRVLKEEGHEEDDVEMEGRLAELEEKVKVMVDGRY